MRTDRPMVVDCETCPGRGLRCDDCMVGALAGLPVVVHAGAELPLDAAEVRAVRRFVAAGLVGPGLAATVTARREPWPTVQGPARDATRAVG